MCYTENIEDEPSIIVVIFELHWLIDFDSFYVYFFYHHYRSVRYVSQFCCTTAGCLLTCIINTVLALFYAFIYLLNLQFIIFLLSIYIQVLLWHYKAWRRNNSDTTDAMCHKFIAGYEHYAFFLHVLIRNFTSLKFQVMCSPWISWELAATFFSKLENEWFFGVVQQILFRVACRPLIIIKLC